MGGACSTHGLCSRDRGNNIISKIPSHRPMRWDSIEHVRSIFAVTRLGELLLNGRKVCVLLCYTQTDIGVFTSPRTSPLVGTHLLKEHFLGVLTAILIYDGCLNSSSACTELNSGVSPEVGEPSKHSLLPLEHPVPRDMNYGTSKEENRVCSFMCFCFQWLYPN